MLVKKGAKKGRKATGDINDKKLDDLLHGEYRPDEFMVRLYNKVFIDKPREANEKQEVTPVETVKKQENNYEYRESTSPDNIAGFEMRLPSSVKGGSRNLCGMQSIAKNKSSSKKPY